MTHLLDMPPDVVGHIVALSGFRGQARLASVSAQLRDAVDSFRRTSGLQRRGDASRTFREALPTVGELMAGEGDRLVTGGEIHSALAIYDRLCPEMPGTEGPLHAWYRQADDLLSKSVDDLLAAKQRSTAHYPGCTHLGAVARMPNSFRGEGREAHGFGTAEAYNGRVCRYIGPFEHGKRSGVGLMEWLNPVRAVIQTTFEADRMVSRGAVTLGTTSDWDAETSSRLWIQMYHFPPPTREEEEAEALADPDEVPAQRESMLIWDRWVRETLGSMYERKREPAFANVTLRLGLH